MALVHFVRQHCTIEVENGITLLKAAQLAKVVVESPCNGMGTCGKCRVLLPDAESRANVRYESAQHKISEQDKAAGWVLACQTTVWGDVNVDAESTAAKNKTLKILDEGKSFSYELRPAYTKRYDGVCTHALCSSEELGTEEGDTTAQQYGLSIDIGTTTVVTALVDLRDGRELASVSSLNPQSLQAQDVLTRIHFASKPVGLKQMYDSITEELSRMIADAAQKAGVETRYIYEAVYSGNTAMIHLATNVNPESLGRFPYTPMIRGGNQISAQMLGISPFGRIYLPPIISSYVGPDITSGVLASQLNRQKGTVLFIDIGTNGEMVIARDGSLSATSTAAGPAFEGMNITNGMRAAAGAVEYFRVEDDGNITVRTIGNATAVGICGSGLLDVVGELVHAGAIGSNGRFVPPEKGTYSDSIKARMTQYEGKPAFDVADGVVLTQKDVRQVQLAKGAIRAGIEALLLNEHVLAQEVDRVEIAGSFGYHLREESLIHLGLLPESFTGKVAFVGNTSKSGGKAFLLNTRLREEMLGVTSKIDSVELSNRDDFQKIFVDALKFRPLGGLHNAGGVLRGKDSHGFA